MDAINFSCQGDSHISVGKVCQDYSLSKIYDNGIAIAIVCDGHGGSRYFRSDVGARIAAEVTERKLLVFIAEAAKPLLQERDFGQIASLSTQIERNDFNKQSEIERAFRHLAGSIIFEWDNEVKAHALLNPIQDNESIELDADWINDFPSGNNLEKTYGCTLIASVYTPDYWFAFQIGDGKCFTVNGTGEWTEPIPWDDRCFLNNTTSICDPDAINEFRFCYQGNGISPVAIFLASDGLDDSFGTPDNQANFYTQILKSIVKSGVKNTIVEIESTLPQLSKIGSKDDMSLAMVFSEERIREIYSKLIEWQIAEVENHVNLLQFANSEEENYAAKEGLKRRLAILQQEYNEAVAFKDVE